MNREYINDISMGTTVVTNKASHNNFQQNVFSRTSRKDYIHNRSNLDITIPSA